MYSLVSYLKRNSVLAAENKLNLMNVYVTNEEHDIGKLVHLLLDADY